MKARIAVLAGDGIGPEIMAQALRVLKKIEVRFGHQFEIAQGLVGGAAYDVFAAHLPVETLDLCRGGDAVLFGSVGGPVAEQHLPKWKGCEANAILALRKAFGFNVNIRPCKVYRGLEHLCPLKSEIIDRGIDLCVYRELNGDIYFGDHERVERNGEIIARDVAEYAPSQVRAIAHAAFRAARQRRKRVTSVDKANVLETSKLWREVVNEVAKEYSDVRLEHMLVDNCAMQLIRDPSSFDIILTSNLFGDILSDEAAVFPGSLGLTPSASLNAKGLALYEPSGGSAPDIAGKGIANPTAQILCVALMLRISFGLVEEAAAIEKAVECLLASGCGTADLLPKSDKVLKTQEFCSAILEHI